MKPKLSTIKNNSDKPNIFFPFKQAAIQSHVEVVKLLIGYQPHLLLLTDKWAKLPVDYITSESSEELKLILQPSK